MGTANYDTTLKKRISLKIAFGFALKHACPEWNRKDGSRAHDHFHKSTIVT